MYRLWVMPCSTRRSNFTPRSCRYASCCSHASRFGSAMAMWLIAHGMPLMDHSAGGGGRFGFSISAMSWWLIAPSPWSPL